METLSQTERQPITSDEIETRATELLRNQYTQGNAAPNARRVKTVVAERIKEPDVRSWYARRAYFELLGERIDEVISPERQQEIAERRQELVGFQLKDGYESEIVASGEMFGDSLVIYAHNFMRGMHMVEDYDRRDMEPLTDEEYAVLCAQHCAQTMAMYEVF